MSALRPNEIISIVLLAIGLIFCLTTIIGIYRLPDFYSRCHASGNSETVGLMFVCLGFIVYCGFNMLSVKIAILFFIVCACNPIGSHVLARAAYRNGFPMTTIGKEDPHANHDH